MYSNGGDNIKIKNTIVFILILFLFVSLVGVVCASEDSATNNITVTDTGDSISQQISNEKLQLTDDDNLSATYDVSGTSFSDIQTAINNAADGDIIYLGGKTFTASGSTITVNKQLTIIGGSSENPDSFSTLNGNGNGHPFFTLSAPGITLTNIRFINGNHGNDQTSGAIDVQRSDCTISNSAFESCVGVYGGAIYSFINASNLKIDNCNFTNNRVEWSNQGGALYLSCSTEITNCNFNGNNAQSYGAVYSGGTISVINSNFTDNSASGVCGALYINRGNSLIDNCNFDGNTAPNYGSVYSGGTTNVVNSNFTDNSASNEDGGALVIIGENSLIDNCNFIANQVTQSYLSAGAVSIHGSNSNIVNSRFERNKAGSGGALVIEGLDITIDNCNFSENTANSFAGAVYVNHDRVKVSNCIMTDNTANNGGAIAVIYDDGEIDNVTFIGNTANQGSAIYSDGSGLQVSDSCFEGTSDLSVSRDTNSLIFTLNGDFGNSISGNAELNDLNYWDGESKVPVVMTEGTKFYIVNSNVTVEIYDSNNNLVDNYTDLTDGNGQITYDYSQIPFGDYTYKAYYTNDATVMDEGFLFNFVSGNRFSDIQNAIDATPAGGTVYLKNITYNNDMHANMVINKPISIVGADGTVLDAEGYSRIFSITSGDVNLTDIAFVNGYVSDQNGAAINIGNNCNNVVITDSNFTNNVVNGWSNGGAISTGGANTQITNCNFDSNTAARGGAINVAGTNAKIENCNFTQNHARNEDGGAIYATGAGLTVNECMFEDNAAHRNGNDIFSNGANGLVEESSFGGASDLIVVGGNNQLTITLSADLGNAIAGSIEKENLYYWDGKTKTPINLSEGSIVPLANKNVTVEIYDSNGNLINNTTAPTDGNGQIIYDYSYLPFGDYNYAVYSQDNPSIMKNGKLYNIVSGNFSGIQAAINAASPGDTLYLMDDVYYNDISGTMVIDKPLTIIGVDGTVLDAEGESRIFTINANVPNVVLENIEFVNGFIDTAGGANGHGGAIYINGNCSNGVIRNCSFSNNTASVGGGAIRNQGGWGWKIYNSTFINNTVTGGTSKEINFGGGAIWSCNAVMDIYNSTFKDNNATYGGALRGPFNIYESEFDNNLARDGNGGAIDVATDRGLAYGLVLEFRNSTFTNNDARGDRYIDDGRAEGGAIHIFEIQEVDMYDCVCINNTADRGGAVDFYKMNVTYVDNCTFVNNNASSEGGGLAIFCSDSTFKDSVISNNNAGTDGGAIWVIGDNSKFINVTSNNNTASRGGSSYIEGSNTLVANSTFNNNSAIYNGTEESGRGGAIDVLGDNCKFVNVTSNNNNASLGGSSFIRGENTVVTNCTLDNNNATLRGGGINIMGNNCNVTNVDVSNNRAGTDGGAVYVRGNDATFVDVYSFNNTANRGGSTFVEGDNADVHNCTLVGNNAYNSSSTGLSGRGGGLDLAGENCKVYDLEVSNNHADGEGGAVYIRSSNLDIYDINSVNNTAQLGGSTFVLGNNITIHNCTLKNNTADLRGGGINVFGNDCKVYDVDVSNNKAGTDGGAVYVLGNGATFEDVYSVNNTASRGGSTFIKGDNALVHNCTLDGNKALSNGTEGSGRGGALDIAGENCQVYDLDVSENHADGEGGAMYIKSNDLNIHDIHSVDNSANLGGSTFIEGNNTVVHNCTFDGNNATLRGGGLNILGDNCTVYDVDVSDNNAGSEGGAVYVRGNDATFRNVTSINNTASRGGSTFIIGDNAEVHNCTLDNNKAIFNGTEGSGRGGGIDIAGDNCKVYDLEVSNNHADREGGAIYIKSSDLNIYEIDSVNNTASRGGSVFIEGDNITVSNSTFSNNKAIFNESDPDNSGIGGAIDVFGNDCKFINVTSVNNTAYRGGSTFVRGDNTVIKDCILDNNTATLRGGGLNIAGDNCTIENVDVSNNKAGLMGGAIYVNSDGTTLTNVTADNNTAECGGAAFINGTNIIVRGGELNNNRASFNESNPDASGLGGGFDIVGDNILVDGVNSNNNSAYRGGSTFIRGDNVTVQNCNLDNNSATLRGGGINIAGDGCAVENVSVSNNRAGLMGGAIYVNSNGTTLTNVTADNNTAQRGGAAFINGTGVRVLDSEFNNNKATFNETYPETSGLGGGMDIVGNDCYINNTHSNNNSAYRGGSTFIRGNNVTVTNCNLDNNTADLRGGGLNVGGDNCTFENLTISNCNATEQGGAVYVIGNNNVFDNVTSVNNTARFGGSSCIEGDDNTVRNCVMDNNTAEVNGGGLAVYGNNCDFINVSLSNNQAKSEGGAVYVLGNSTFFDNITSKNNTAKSYGGSTQVHGNNVTVKNSIFTDNNVTAGAGGAISVDGDECSFINNTISSNEASGFGGGIYAAGNNCTFSDNNISDNTANFGGGIGVFGENSNFTNNNITFNEAHTSGGAAYVEGWGEEITYFTNNNISSNHAESSGGGIASLDVTVKLDQIYGYNNTAPKGGFAEVVNGYEVTVENSTFISNHALGDIADGDGIGGGLLITGSNYVDVQADFYNNTATNGSAIYVGDTNGLSVHDSKFYDNQAHSYYLLAAPENGTVYEVGDDKIVKFSHIGGDNIANAIHNLDGESEITIRNITFPFYHNGVVEDRTTPNEDLTPVLGYSNFNGTNIYIDDLEDNQVVYYEVYDNETGKLIRNGSARTDIDGSISIDLSDLGVGVYLVKAWYNETTYYTEISNETIIVVVDSYNPNMTVGKDALNGTTIYVNDIVAFNITVINTGNEILGNVTVNEFYNPNELEYFDHTNKTLWNKSGDVFTYLNDLGIGENATFTIWFKTLTNGTLVNNVTAKSNITNETNSSANITVYSPNMTVEKVSLNVTDFVIVNDTVAFNITVTSTGDCVLGNVNVTEVFNDSEFKYLGFVGADWSVSQDNKTFFYGNDLGVGANATFTVYFKALVNGTLVNNVTARSNVTNDTNDTANVTVYSPNMTVEKVSLNITDFVVVNDTVAFNITVTNTGDCVLGNVNVTEVFDANEFEYLRFVGAYWSISHDNKTFFYGNDLGIGANATFTIFFKALTNGTLVNNVTARSNVTNDTNDTANVTVYSPNMTVLKVSLNSTDILYVGDVVAFNITVVNNGDCVLGNVIVTESYLDGVEFEYLNHTDETKWIKNGYIFIYQDNLGIGENATFTIYFKALTNGTLVNNVTARSNVTNETNSSANVTVYNKITINVTKVWNDSDNHDGFRPQNVTFVLYADGKEYARIDLNGTGNIWTGNFTDLPTMNSNGTVIVYTVDELPVANYTKTVVNSTLANYTIMNTYVVNFTSVNVTKVWNDSDDHDGFRPENVTFVLYADGVENATIVLNEGNNWMGSFSNLSMYKDGKAIVYTVDERPVANYTKSVVNSTLANYTIMNTHIPYNPNMTVQKVTLDNVVFVNNTVRFMIVVTNTGDRDLHNVTVTEIFDSKELEYNGMVDDTGKWRQTGDYVFVYDGALAIGNSTNFTVVFTALVNGTLTNTVNVTSNETDNKTGNNTTDVYKPNMTVQKVTLDNVVFVNNTVSFMIVVTNTGDCDLHNVTVSEIFNSKELEFRDMVDVTGKWTRTGDYVFVYDGALAKGNSTNFTVVFTALVNGTLQNQVNVSSNETDNKTGNNTTDVYKPNMTVQKVTLDNVVFVNNTVRFMIVVTNTGDCDLHNVTVTEIFNSKELEFKDIVDVTGKWTRTDDYVFVYDGALAKGNSTNFTVVFTALVNGTLQNQVNVSSNETDNKTGNNTTDVYKPNMTVVKLALNKTVIVGENVTFVIVVTNTGDCNLTDIAVYEDYKDTEYELVKFIDDTHKWTNSSNVFTYDGNLTPGSSANFTLVFKTLVNGTLINMVNATSNQTDNKTANNNTTVSELCDLVVIKQVNATSIFVNETVEWTIIVENKGPNTAKNVVVNDTLPAGVVVIGELPNNGKLTGNNIVWELGDLVANADPIVLKFVTKITREGNNTNFVVVNTTTPDSNESNNKANNTTVANAICDLEIHKYVNASHVYANDTVEWNITLVNKGPSTAFGVVVNDTLPDGLKIISATPTAGSFDEETRIWQIDELRINSPVFLILVTRVLTNGTFMNTVVVNSTTPDSNESNNIANNTTVADPICDLVITKSVNASVVNVTDIVEWTITVVNRGPNTAENVVVNDTLPNGLKVLRLPENCKQNGNTIIWNIGSLEVDSPVSITLLTQVLVEGNITNIVVVNSTTPDTNETNNIANNTTVANPVCDLEIIKLVSSKKAYVGEDLTWTIIVINHGPSAASDVKVLEDIPDSLRLVSYTATKGTFDKNTNIWTIGKLDNASTVTLKIVTRVLSVGNITNPVDVTTSTPDSNETNNHANNTTEASELCDLAIMKSSDYKVYYVGDNMHWIIEVVNYGPSPARGVWVSDVMPSGVKFIRYSASKGNYDKATGNWTIGTLANGERVTLDILCKVMNPGLITNSAHVTGSGNESNLTDNDDNATISAIEKVQPVPPSPEPTPEPTPESTPEPENPVHEATMHATGNPIAYLLVAVFALFGCFWSRKKQE